MEILFLAPRADVPLAIGSLLAILWKYTLMHWYKVDIEKKNFIKDTVWGQAIRRFAEVCLVQLAKYRKAQARAQARGAHEPTTSTTMKWNHYPALEATGHYSSQKSSQKNSRTPTANRIYKNRAVPSTTEN
jgi:hypothetical protein